VEDVRTFLDASCELVPLGEESAHFDVDGLIEEISNV
jgi:hypothetical protein